MRINNNPYTNNFTSKVISKGEEYYYRDFKPTESIPENVRNESYIDFSWKTVLGSVIVLLAFYSLSALFLAMG